MGRNVYYYFGNHDVVRNVGILGVQMHAEEVGPHAHRVIQLIALPDNGSGAATVFSCHDAFSLLRAMHRWTSEINPREEALLQAGIIQARMVAEKLRDMTRHERLYTCLLLQVSEELILWCNVLAVFRYAALPAQ